jgi:beta-glucosidase
VSDALGDRVQHWITHNEPWVAAFLGHLYGVHAPGLRDWRAAILAGHHILVSHAAATEVLRQTVSDAVVGMALDCRPALPASSSEADIEATIHFDGLRNRWFFDPVFGRGYPDDILEALIRLGRVDSDLSFIHAGDMERIATPIDFLGLNYYTTTRVAAGSEESEAPERPPGPDQEDGFTEMGWRIDPEGLREYLVWIHERYEPASIVITENGASYSEGPDEMGVVNESRRIDYLRLHIEAMAAAVSDGVPVDGYFVWSLLDNVEWTHGFEQRFGLVWVDPETLARTPKASFGWYRDSISPGGWASGACQSARYR